MDIKKFLDGSKSFNGIVCSGNYTIPMEHFFVLYNHFKKTGNNLLDAYSDCVYWSWYDDDCTIDHGEYNAISESMSQIRALRLPNFDLLIDSRINAKNALKRHIELLNKEANKPRADASKFTSRKDIRETVFWMHGKRCLACGSTKNITLDHIIPVSKGGKNIIDNGNRILIFRSLLKLFSNWFKFIKKTAL